MPRKRDYIGALDKRISEAQLEVERAGVALSAAQTRLSDLRAAKLDLERVGQTAKPRAAKAKASEHTKQPVMVATGAVDALTGMGSALR